MENWKSVKDIISNFQQKGRVKKGFLLNAIRDRLKKNFNINEDFDLDFCNKNLEIKTKNSVLAQEIFLRREEIKEDINSLFKKENISGYKVDKVIVKPHT